MGNYIAADEFCDTIDAGGGTVTGRSEKWLESCIGDKTASAEIMAAIVANE